MSQFLCHLEEMRLFMWPYLGVEAEGHCPKSMQKFGLEGYTFWGVFFVGLISRKSDRLSW